MEQSPSSSYAARRIDDLMETINDQQETIWQLREAIEKLEIAAEKGARKANG